MIWSWFIGNHKFHIYLMAITFLLVYPEICVSDYELVPFKLKELPPKKSAGDPLETLRVINVRTDIKRPVKSNRQIILRGGYPILFGSVKNQEESWIPFFSVGYKYNYLEFELGYFGLNSKTNLLPNKRVSHLFPVTVSLVGDIHLSNKIIVSPKIGAGAMLTLTHANFSNSYYSTFALGKAAIEFSFRIGKHFYIKQENSLLIGQDLQEKLVSNLHFYFIPSLAVSYRL